MENRFSFPKLKIALKVISAFFVFIILGLFLFKSAIVKSIANSRIQQIEEKTGWDISYSSMELSGISELKMQDFSVLNKQKDTIATLGSTSVKVNLFYWLNGNSLIGKAVFQNGNVALNTLVSRNKSASDTTKKAPRKDINLVELQDIYRRQIRRFIPGDIIAENIHIHFHDSLGPIALQVNQVNSYDDSISGEVVIIDSVARQTWNFSGNKKQGLQIHGEPASATGIPVLNSRLGADLRLRAFDVDIQFPDGKRSSTQLSGSVEGFSFYHPKISSDTIVFEYLSGKLPLLFGLDGIQTDTGAAFGVNHITGKFSFFFPLTKLKPVYKLHIQGDWIDGNDFFASLPQGAFHDTRPLKADGALRYSLDFELDGRNPDSVMFNSTLEKKNFRLEPRSYGSLAVMNGSFMHEVFENGRVVRTIRVGPENPAFTPFEEVPKTLINAILTAEDPSFFYHNGFIQEAFRESIAENYRAGRFKRGGSTISMQLVKNVFLSRKKTVFRKIEEALIVWLIENQRITSKQRMMEVYLNIIEWGPGVYGVKEAAAYYFRKPPSQLTLQECLFLANIIPRPKNFRYAFDTEGQLRHYMEEQCRFIMRRMATRELLTEQDTTGFTMELKVTGPAKALITPEVTVSDSLDMEMPFIHSDPLD